MGGLVRGGGVWEGRGYYGELVNREPLLKFESGLDHRMLQRLNASSSKAQAMPSIVASNGQKAYCRLCSFLAVSGRLGRTDTKSGKKTKTKQTKKIEHDGLVTERRMKHKSYRSHGQEKIRSADIILQFLHFCLITKFREENLGADKYAHFLPNR